MKDSASHPVFSAISATPLTPATFDAALIAASDTSDAANATNTIVAIFFWGHDCPNCEVAKKMLHQDADEVNSLSFRWHHVNVYEHSELGTRFGLHGIPTFLFFYEGKKLGKISPFPGMTPFMEALRSLKQKTLGQQNL